MTHALKKRTDAWACACATLKKKPATSVMTVTCPKCGEKFSASVYAHDSKCAACRGKAKP